ncbi:MAG: anthranilate phosphoribosyltransferase [Aigarchaeota archaeon]|nr:anthranilate phosphoribosyltransferase [Aigarchaeota archaeon]MDW8092524.1 anthranilate phosphoribosyltransferase [Nitrososphaerota archaeon]
MILEAIERLVGGGELTESEARLVTLEILRGEATPAQTASFLTAISIRGETEEVIVGMVRAMRESSITIRPSVNGRLIDTSGTGGDNGNTFNASTSAAIIAAGAGVYVAKHGNRAVSSKCGSADVLGALGINLSAGPEVVKGCIERVGIGFLFAPNFHPAMKAVAGVRRELRMRTVFNLLGPLTNPAGANAQVIGVSSERLMGKVASVVRRLGTEESLIVYGNGLDEVSVTGPTTIIRVSNGEVSQFSFSPNEIGMPLYDHTEISVASVESAANLMFNLLYDPPSVKPAVRDFALLNAAAALMVSGRASNLEEGRDMAREALYSGRPYEKLKLLVKYSGGDLAVLEGMEVGRN